METEKVVREKLDIDPYLFNNLHPITIVLIGCGGTGSLLLSRLARINEVLLSTGHKGFHVTAVDGDEVEEKNIGRQLFTREDIGRDKSECLISKINLAFGTNWDSERRNLTLATKSFLNQNIIISCVDNMKARDLINNTFKKVDRNIDYRKNYYWIDCGNGKDYGQVLFADKEEKLCPTLFQFDPEVSKKSEDATQGLGCSIWESLQEQDLLVNDDVALMASQMIWDMFKYRYLDYHGVFTNLQTGGRSRALIKNL